MFESNNKALKCGLVWNQPPWSSCDGCECKSVSDWSHDSRRTSQMLYPISWGFAANSLETRLLSPGYKFMCFFSFCKVFMHKRLGKASSIWVNQSRTCPGLITAQIQKTDKTQSILIKENLISDYLCFLHFGLNVKISPNLWYCIFSLNCHEN